MKRRAFLASTAAGSIAVAGIAGGYLATGTAQAAGSEAPAVFPVAADVDISSLARVRQELVKPPFLPAHEQIASGAPKIVEVRFEIEEKEIVVDDDEGAKVWAFTYGGTVPGPMIVVHEGDYVELTLVNPETSQLEHNIDFHASTGALGCGALTHVAPGQQVVVRWKAVKPGVFVYHCAPGGDMIPYHVVHGMNGAVMVLPRDGLKDGAGNPLHYDRAYYIGEQDFYLKRGADGDFVRYESPIEDYSDAMEVMKTLTPSQVVFNGAKGSLTGDNAMHAKVGETVLIIHAQANRDTRPHLIGGHGDYVWEQGSFANSPAEGLETWFIRGGSAGAALYTFRQPGLYAYVNHNLIEAIYLGAAAHFQVEGEWDDNLMTTVSAPGKIKEV